MSSDFDDIFREVEGQSRHGFEMTDSQEQSADEAQQYPEKTESQEQSLDKEEQGPDEENDPLEEHLQVNPDSKLSYKEVTTTFESMKERVAKIKSYNYTPSVKCIGKDTATQTPQRMALCNKCKSPYTLDITASTKPIVIDLTFNDPKPGTSGNRFTLTKPDRSLHVCGVCSLPMSEPGQTAHSQCLAGLSGDDFEEVKQKPVSATKRGHGGSGCPGVTVGAIRCEVCTFVVEGGARVHEHCKPYLKKMRLSSKGKGRGKRSRKDN